MKPHLVWVPAKRLLRPFPGLAPRDRVQPIGPEYLRLGSAENPRLVDKPVWAIDPDDDLARAKSYFATRITSPGTWQGYLKGLAKLETYLRLTCHHPPKEKTVNWAY